METSKTGLFFLNTSRDMFKAFPNDFRSGIFQSFDRTFAWILAACVVVVFGLILVFSMRVPSEEISEKEILKIQERYAQLVLNQPKPEKVEEKKADSDAAAAAARRKREKEAAEAAEKESLEKVKQESVEDRQKRKEVTREQRLAKRDVVRKQVQSVGILAEITAAGTSRSGRGSSQVSNLLGAAGGVGDLGNVNISKGSFATRNVTAQQLESRRGERTTGVGIEKSSVGTIDGGRIASAGEVRITTQPPEMKSESGGAVGSKACIQSVITRESHRIKRVYENWLKRDPALGGQLKVRFFILATGMVGDVSVVNSSTGNSEFDENILRYIKRWDFSTCSVDESIEIVFPFAFSGAS
jgi:TonB family protein